MSNGITDLWPAHKIAVLRELWDMGYPARKIGAHLGISASSVIGKAHRLHLAPRPSPIKPRLPGTPREGRTVTNGSARGTHSLPVGAGALPELPSLEVSTSAEEAPPLNFARSCQWIEADPRIDATMCGMPTLVGSSYCPPHHARCWTKRPTWGAQTAEIGLPDPMRGARATVRGHDVPLDYQPRPGASVT